ncbi:dihydrodipicolinate synthase family protein [Corynebacterium sp. 153RC1]|uniref:dihydrodipicolinate synthase family protein n=1 Tax=unclassified Corynebacterium TaxID=2624378 RepID=UPI00211BBC76|nr:MULTISPECIES: dihydrodipicolinate synthase family protein [unclassified Corynebacterium]MCQ9370497.1 dihydrodipicolinate synthase family protein [Corynebacterium sp. 35RC1]MCQ9351804.1 dihydrodipicolinate synthase family protein [Corynebacterium sp. 209RC1]MCQ9354540.1 dihydrodipicolinate synthase family protein [Corynebacterium sp. 1222RC1]MCQ9356086.1 dihydrodipicolinate synthase family protein [Corynebacterium sp. 122RC1]MCQ9358718.1 dihydrodipicolinate synthase family protein [Corynebac
MSSIVHGVVPPVVTPLHADRTVDYQGLSAVVDHLLAGGVHGLFVLGSSGEVAFLSDEDREAVITAVVEQVQGRVPVYAGVIDMQTNRVIQHIRAAERAGVDAVVATAPFYAITGPVEVEEHFRQLHAATSLPIIAYDIPVCVHTKLSPEMLVRLGVDGVLAGVKDSSGDDVSFRRLAAQNKAAGHPLTLLTGHEVVVDGAYMAGADGCVPGLGNVDPAGYVRMWDAYQAGDWETVRQEQDRLAALFEIVFQPVGKVGPAAGVGAFKTALELMGVIESNLMSQPLPPISDAPSRQAITEILRGAGVL